MVIFCRGKIPQLFLVIIISSYVEQKSSVRIDQGEHGVLEEEFYISTDSFLEGMISVVVCFLFFF